MNQHRIYTTISHDGQIFRIHELSFLGHTADISSSNHPKFRIQLTHSACFTIIPIWKNSGHFWDCTTANTLKPCPFLIPYNVRPSYETIHVPAFNIVTSDSDFGLMCKHYLRHQYNISQFIQIFKLNIYEHKWQKKKYLTIPWSGPTVFYSILCYFFSFFFIYYFLHIAGLEPGTHSTWERTPTIRPQGPRWQSSELHYLNPTLLRIQFSFHQFRNKRSSFPFS